MWLSYTHDTKQNLKLVQDDQDPLTATLNALKEKLQLHVVDIIGEKAVIILFTAPESLKASLYRSRCLKWTDDDVDLFL